MKAVVKPNGSVDPKDSRGLPWSLDPRHFYEYSSEKVIQGTSGLEMLIWNLIPYSYIRSFAIAIDPLYKFKVSQARISGVNRTRTRGNVSVTQQINKLSYSLSSHVSSVMFNGCPTGKLDIGGTPTTVSSVAYKPSKALLTSCRDSTKRTRPLGVDYGECNYFTFTTASPSRKSERLRKDYSTSIYGSCAVSVRIDKWDYVNSDEFNAGAYLTQTSLNSIINREDTDVSTLMSKRGLELVRRAMPESRSFNLARSVVELKDLPRSIASLQKTLGDLSSVQKRLGRLDLNIWDLRKAAKDIPSEYLSFHFGWKQLYEDVMSTLFKPQKIVKRINRLIERNGLATTFRSQSKLTDVYVGGSGHTYVGSAYDVAPLETAVRCERSRDLRCIINARFDFPPVDQLKFRNDLFRRQLGSDLSPADLYDLVPWTWLYDWWSGLGNYLHIIEEISSDRSLINFGFVSCKTHGTVFTSYTYGNRDSGRIVVNGVTENYDNVSRKTHTSTIDFIHYMRKDVANLTNVRATSNMSSLTTYQSTILGALFAQRLKF